MRTIVLPLATDPLRRDPWSSRTSGLARPRLVDRPGRHPPDPARAGRSHTVRGGQVPPKSRMTPLTDLLHPR